jgi:hypothetical protein
VETKCIIHPNGTDVETLTIPPGDWIATNPEKKAIVSGATIDEVVEIAKRLSGERGLDPNEIGLEQQPNEREREFIYGGGSNARG